MTAVNHWGGRTPPHNTHGADTRTTRAIVPHARTQIDFTALSLSAAHVPTPNVYSIRYRWRNGREEALATPAKGGMFTPSAGSAAGLGLRAESARPQLLGRAPGASEGAGWPGLRGEGDRAADAPGLLEAPYSS